MPAFSRPVHASERPLLVFIIAFVALTAVAWMTVPGLAGRVTNVQLAERPPGEAHYLAHDRGGHVDHHALYFGTVPEAITSLREADVLFLGNSRLMFALRPQALEAYFAAHGLDYYVLGFGFREGDAFPLEIIERYDLRPRLVVVNADAFFGAGLSPWADRVVRDTAFGSWKRYVEAETAHEARRVIHEVVPNWLDLFGRPGFESGREFIAYRSWRDGTWIVSPWPDPVMPVPAPQLDAAIGPRVAGAARAFHDELAARGSRLVLTFVPTPEPSATHARTVSRALDVPLVVPPVDGLLSHDGSHLGEASATMWTERFLEALTPHLPR